MEQFNGLFKVIAKAPILGRQRGKFFFENKEGSVAGTVTFMRNEVEMTDIVINGNEFTAVAEAPSPMGPVRLDITGAIDGDKISGVMKSNVGDMTFEGEKEA